MSYFKLGENKKGIQIPTLIQNNVFYVVSFFGAHGLFDFHACLISLLQISVVCFLVHLKKQTNKGIPNPAS